MATGFGNLTICIPYRAYEDKRREQIGEWIVDRYDQAFPDARIALCDSDEGFDFNRSEARNAAANMAETDILYFADADTLTYPEQIQAAVKLIERDPAQWVITQNTYYLATNETTDFILSQPPDTTEDFRDMPLLDTLRDGVSVAGGYLVTREQYHSVKGFDERFKGWGYEDTAFKVSMETLWDSAYRNKDSYVMHLEHPAVRFDDPNIGFNEAIFAQYSMANGNRDLMLEVINQR